MKRFLSLMLVAMLLVGCMTTVAYAADEQTGSFTVKVSGNYANFSGSVKTNGEMQITNITSNDGVVCNPANGQVAFAAGSNAKRSVSFTVSWKVPAGATCEHSHSISVSVSAKKCVYKEDGTPNGTVAADGVKVSGGGKTVTIDHSWDDGVVQIPATCGDAGQMLYTCTKCGATKEGAISATGEHQYGDWITDTAATCHTDGTKHKECSVCGHVKDGTISATGKHVADSKWHIGEKTHWHVCTTDGCGEKLDQAKHTGKWKTVIKATTTKEGKEEFVCTVCGYEDTRTVDKLKETNTDLPVVDMGDTTPYGTYNAMVFAAAVIILFTVYALISKRKSVK